MRKQGISRNKFCKGTGIPKRSGNFSQITLHYQSLQHQTWRIWYQGGHLVVGNHTPLLALFPAAIVELVMNDELFSTYEQRGYKTINGKKYEIVRSITRFAGAEIRGYLHFNFIYREAIYTDGDFDWNFPEY